VKLSRKLLLTGAAIALPLGMLAVSGVAGASAHKGKVTATGKLTCTAIKGTISFSPPLKTTGPFSTETSTAKITVSGCTGGSVNPKSGKVDQSLSSATSTNDCTSLATSNAETLNIKWAGKINPSTTSFSGYSTGANGAGDEGFILPQSKGTGSTVGSYAEASGATAAAYSNETEAQILAACGTSAGLKKLTLTTGSSTS
jgi:hypothetical protein